MVQNRCPLQNSQHAHKRAGGDDNAWDRSSSERLSNIRERTLDLVVVEQVEVWQLRSSDPSMRDGQASNRILNIEAHHSDIKKPRTAAGRRPLRRTLRNTGPEIVRPLDVPLKNAHQAWLSLKAET